MEMSEEKEFEEYVVFLKTVERTVFMDNLSPTTTSTILKCALSQFGDVINVEFTPNYTVSQPIPSCALVEMKSQKQATTVVAEISDDPFMLFGKPRPVRAMTAKAEMFMDPPPIPDEHIEVVLVKTSHPNVKVGREMRRLCRKHMAETLMLIKMSEEQEFKEYVVFLKTVERTVFMDNLSPTTTSTILKCALSQFGDVISVEFIPNYTVSQPIPSCALVEMKSKKQATAVVAEISDNPFMLFGKPRPVRAMTAKAEMFMDPPPIPDEHIEVVLVKTSHPNVKVGREMRRLCRKHMAETLMLIKMSEEQEFKEYVVFLKTVERTVFMDNLSPTTTLTILKCALSQFGDVINVEFRPNYTVSQPIPSCALVEMKSQKQATTVVAEISDNPFMLFGKPRPVRAMTAKAEMFMDPPPIPYEHIEVVLVKTSHPNVKVGREMRRLCRKHMAETLMLIKMSEEQEFKEYVVFLKTVERTVFMDNLSPTTTSTILKCALSQFGDVINVEFIPNYMVSQPISSCALVEMKSQKQAAAVVAEITDNPFMLFGKPRPVRAMTAKAEMFMDRPLIPDEHIEVVLV